MPTYKRVLRVKHANHPLIKELHAVGYNSNNLHKLLSCTKNNGYNLINEPEMLKLGQLKAISYAIHKPLGFVINTLLCTPQLSSNWLDESFDLEKKIKSLKEG